MRSLFLAFVLLAVTGRAQTPCDSMATVMGQLLNLYDSLAVEQVQLATTVAEQRVQIDSLRAAIHRGSYSLEKSRKEAETLRRIMKGYVDTIDSLNISNQELHRALDENKERTK